MANNSSNLINQSLSFKQLATAPTDPNLWEIYSDTTTGELLTWNGTTWIQLMSTVAPTSQYWSGYFANTGDWTTTSGSFVDPTPTGTITLTQRQGSGITVTAAASSLPGITFTPASASAVYQVNVSYTQATSSVSAYMDGQITDGVTVIANVATAQEGSLGGHFFGASVSGIYVPGTTSPVTVKLQISTNSSTMTVGGGDFTSMEWSLVRIS
jgi:hypothetical protein